MKEDAIRNIEMSIESMQKAIDSFESAHRNAIEALKLSNIDCDFYDSQFMLMIVFLKKYLRILNRIKHKIQNL